MPVYTQTLCSVASTRLYMGRNLNRGGVSMKSITDYDKIRDFVCMKQREGERVSLDEIAKDLGMAEGTIIQQLAYRAHTWNLVGDSLYVDFD